MRKSSLLAAISVFALVPIAPHSFTRPSPTPADVSFMQGMIAHHAQALVMAALVPSRTRSEALRILARRITVSQQDEIGLMQRWLKDHHEQVPNPDLHPDSMLHPAGMSGMSGMSMPRMGSDSAHPMLMPGMLTPAQLDQLAAARGTTFYRLFLEFMIQHHRGALVMVASLFSTNGAGQDAEVFQLASGIDADQRGEIARMTKMLAAQSGNR